MARMYNKEFLEILSILEPRFVASFMDVSKPIRIREFSSSWLLKCFPHFWIRRIPMNSAVRFSFILIIMPHYSHEQFRDSGLKRISIKRLTGRNIIPLPFPNRNVFFFEKYTGCVGKLRGMSFLDAALLQLCRTRFRFFCNSSCRKSFRTGEIVSWIWEM